MPERRRVAFAAGLGQGGAQVGSAEVEAQRGGHPLIPELTMLSTKKRCRKAKEDERRENRQRRAGHDEVRVHARRDCS